MHLIIGANGLIGRALGERWRCEGVPFLGTTRLGGEGVLRLDLEEDGAGWSWPAAISVAFLAAAETRLQVCEAEPERTARINVEHTVALARRLMAEGALVVYPSTNLVFDGHRPSFGATDPVCPVTEYGRQKARVEAELLGSGGTVAVVRLSKILHPGMELLRGWKQTLQRGEVIRPFRNLRISPLLPQFVAEALHRIAERRVTGIVQLSGDRLVSYAECARQLAHFLGVDEGLIDAIDAPAGLARSSALDPERAVRELDLPAPNVADTLAELFHSLP